MVACVGDGTSKAKDDVGKLLSSKHLLYKQMRAYHNGQTIPGCQNVGFQGNSEPEEANHSDSDSVAQNEFEGQVDVSLLDPTKFQWEERRDRV